MQRAYVAVTRFRNAHVLYFFYDFLYRAKNAAAICLFLQKNLAFRKLKIAPYPPVYRLTFNR